jgi:hypothetical protein
MKKNKNAKHIKAEEMQREKDAEREPGSADTKAPGGS